MNSMEVSAAAFNRDNFIAQVTFSAGYCVRDNLGGIFLRGCRMRLKMGYNISPKKMGQQPTNDLTRTGNVGHVWDVWMIPLSKDRVCHKQNLKDLVPLLAPWFSVPSVS